MLNLKPQNTAGPTDPQHLLSNNKMNTIQGLSKHTTEFVNLEHTFKVLTAVKICYRSHLIQVGQFLIFTIHIYNNIYIISFKYNTNI